MGAALALVGCGPRLEVAARRAAGDPAVVVESSGGRPRNELIMSAVRQALEGAELTIGELVAVLATRGPGSFTGLRVTLATAQGLARALDVVGIGGGSLLVQAGRAAGATCLAVQPARRGVVWAQAFDLDGPAPRPLQDPGLVDVGTLAGAPVPVVAPVGLELGHEVPRAGVQHAAAEVLLDLYYRGQCVAADTLTPLYLEPPAVVPPAASRRAWPPSPRAS